MRRTTGTPSGVHWCLLGFSNCSPFSSSVSISPISSTLSESDRRPLAIGQSILLLIMALPVHNALVTPLNEHKQTILPLPLGLHLSDLFLAVLSLLDIYIQWNADNQQYEYQTYKHALKASPPDNRTAAAHKAWQQGSSRIEWTSRDIKRGFFTRGLFSWSRHPNFACEQVMWLLQGLFPLLSGQPSALTKSRWMVMMNPMFTPFAVSAIHTHTPCL
jgi:steroid 5-alpha reductase family enzyme